MFDVKDEGMDEFLRDLEVAMKNFPKETKRMLRSSGSRARTIVRRYARKLVGSETGNYHKRWKLGKAWSEGANYKVRVYNNAPHAHLIEDGHVMKGKDGTEYGFKEGLKVVDKANTEMEKKWDEILEKELDKIVNKI
ncbi:HK97 gp10 family phage protein [Tindallia californiensis]|uniref:Bacteriophage HK97-gp10, putative tail-component n=1 Tax=Tindallia californiensis TaxID=159292 RepID=A0A1H3R128_9FIRM|nr:HK97 gp10 family phage protein [Tindallia californiensis]SDZ19320.1 Bacteriophage HK97-gp10, putative tail-component [Tindallia californiensis]